MLKLNKCKYLNQIKIRSLQSMKIFKFIIIGVFYSLFLNFNIKTTYAMNKNQPEKEKSVYIPEEILKHIISFSSPSDARSFEATCTELSSLDHKNHDYWYPIVLEERASEAEINKINKGFFSAKNIFLGIQAFHRFREMQCENVLDTEKMKCLKFAAEHGNEKAILTLLSSYKIDELNQEQKESLLKLALGHADTGSENAINYLLSTLCPSIYGIHSEKIGTLAIKYADQGSEIAIYHLIQANKNGLYGFEQSIEGFSETASYYAQRGSRIAELELLQSQKFLIF